MMELKIGDLVSDLNGENFGEIISERMDPETGTTRQFEIKRPSGDSYFADANKVKKCN